ncbi:WhiB family transcriptional regulator [Streptomyces sp. NBC_01207]|uniref:WhiB family transcriptional regulator n=1 Tax=Streptomyces sp. NBC_01207 TaxID=2903772 RepID=UPI002E0F4FAE|nr:WhiB family transcriptional regulator [Streptomyces sp. NBC_01207]
MNLSALLSAAALGAALDAKLDRPGPGFLRDEDGNAIKTPCRRKGALFDPGNRVDPQAREAARAKALCRICPVMEACLAYALESGEPFGVWGGMTRAERQTLQRRRRAVIHSTPA